MGLQQIVVKLTATGDFSYKMNIFRTVELSDDLINVWNPHSLTWFSLYNFLYYYINRRTALYLHNLRVIHISFYFASYLFKSLHSSNRDDEISQRILCTVGKFNIIFCFLIFFFCNNYYWLHLLYSAEISLLTLLSYWKIII